MKKHVGIFGFYFTQERNYSCFKLIPLYRNFKDLREKCNDENNYFLTGFVEYDEEKVPDSFIFNLAAILTFLQQIDVIIEYEYSDINNLDVNEEIIPATTKRINGIGRLFDISEKMQEDALQKLFDRIYKEYDSKLTIDFRSMLFKSIEVYRMRSHFVDITYYLLFSGLEAFCKSYIEDTKIGSISNDVGMVIAIVLNNFGIPFIYKQKTEFSYNHYEKEKDEVKFLRKSLTTYVPFRNKLFHENIFEAVIEGRNGKTYLINFYDYENFLHKLVNFVILRAADIQDEHINWESWTSIVGLYCK